ncbi:MULTISPECIES: hypothetical protein [unclassified Streptomyces]|uniref:hypothetical protein n=1 Tax=unclassified Streptomyces TaxID=2593676 RepID=UPI0036EE1ED5
MIEPGGIPQYTGDFGQLEKAASSLRTHATGIRSGGKDVHSRFQATAAYYKAPEADRLFSSTQPVMDTSEEFAGNIEALADALDTFVFEARPHADRLGQLKLDAFTFVDSVRGEDDWTEDQARTDAHQALMDGVAAAREGFQEAERNAANKINAISPGACRPQWVVDDGTHGLGMYGQSADELKDMKDLPWGSPEGRTYERWSLEWWGHGAKSWAWDGIAKDSIWGGIDGLGTLIGFHGGEARDQAWDGLRRTAVGGYAYGMDLFGQGDHLSGWQRDSKAYAKEFGKQFIAYDTWEEDPARAHAVVSFNILTLAAGPLGAASKLGKGGTFAKAAGTVARIGDALDPLGGAFKAAKALSDLPKVSQVLANVSDHLQLPKTKFPDGAFDLSDRYRVDKDGNLIPLDRDGTPNTAPVPHEPAAAERSVGTGPDDRELVGAGARAGEGAARRGEGLPPQAGHDSSAGGGGDVRSEHRRGGPGGGGSATHDAGPGARSPDRVSAPAGARGVGDGGHQGSGSSSRDARPGDARVDGQGAGRGSDRADGSEGADTGGSHESTSGDGGTHGDVPESGEQHGEPTAVDSVGTHHDAGQHGDGEGAGEPDFTRPTLPPGEAQLSLRQLRALRAGRHRYTMAEEIGREMFGGGPEWHFPVPTHDHPYYPVEAPGGRKVDVPVDLPDGRTLAVEVKHYLQFRTIKLSDGTSRTVKGEVPMNAGMMEQINKDLTLRRMDPGYDPRWVFMDAPPSQALRNYLVQARIVFVEYGPAPK